MLNPSVANAGDRSDEPPSVGTAAVQYASTLIAILMLAVDELNPIKVCCGYTQNYLQEQHIAVLAGLLLLGLAVNQRHRLLYYLLRLFFRCSFNNMFFRSVEIVGLENVPQTGPIIFTGNHNNQFVDGVILLTNCHREISFMIAQKSFDRPMVGFLARCFHCIPVSRPQDSASAGAGLVRTDGTDVLHGEGTRFASQVRPGDSLEIKSQAQPVKVKEVTSDSEVRLESTARAADPCSYKVLQKVDQSQMYDSVYTSLKQGKCLGIFPEGGSHDRTDLLPLKAGVAIIALDAFRKYHLEVPIVPVGLNYFQGHRFGGRVVLEFGTPIRIPDAVYAQSHTDRRAATDWLLQTITAAMRSVIVPTPDYQTLQQIYMVRRLYVPEWKKLSAAQAMDLNRRFAVAIQRYMQLAKQSVKPPEEEGPETPKSPSVSFCEQSSKQEDMANLSEQERKELNDLRSELEDYMSALKRLGVRDYQVPQIGWWSMTELIEKLVYLTVTMGVGIIPQIMFNLPMIMIASKLAVTEQQKALKASSVKLAARDVVMSYKIIFVLACIPLMYVAYGLLLLTLSSWSKRTIVLFLLACPLFAFLGMKASEHGVRTYADVAPLVKRLLPGRRDDYEALPAKRHALQRRLNAAVKKFGPRLGDVYYAKEVDWSKVMGPGAMIRASSFHDTARGRAGIERVVMSEAMEGACTQSDGEDTGIRRRRG